VRQLSTSYRLDRSTGLVFDQSSKDKKKPRFQTIIGLEIHAQLDISTKLFSNAAVSTRDRPNSAISGALHPYDVAVPGYLPVLSKEAVQAAVLAAGILQCNIATLSRFERKHYSYADLPFHYQITQQRWPLAVGGEIEATYVPNPKKKHETHNVKCRINRIQLEQDTGKTVQGGSVKSSNGTEYSTSRVDFNRAGQALIEIVSEPDLRTPLEASAVTETLRQLLKHVGICNGRMEEGSLRCDVNVNIEEVFDDPEDETKPKRSPRVEVKNLNSIRQVRESIEFEALRQAKEWSMDDDDLQSAETRTWDPTKKSTILIRIKNEEQDYRFMPEPDIPPLILNDQVLNGLSLESFLETRTPELPLEAVRRLQERYGLSEYQAQVIAGDPPAIAFVDRAVKVASREALKDMLEEDVAIAVSNLLANHLFSLLKEHGENEEGEATIQESQVSAEQLGQVVALQLDGKISKQMAKKLISILYLKEVGGIPSQVAADCGMELISDPEKLRAICNQVIDKHPDELEVYKKGGKFKNQITKLFSGKAMELSKRNAEPESLRDILAATLEERSNS